MTILLDGDVFLVPVGLVADEVRHQEPGLDFVSGVTAFSGLDGGVEVGGGGDDGDGALVGLTEKGEEEFVHIVWVLSIVLQVSCQTGLELTDSSGGF